MEMTFYLSLRCMADEYIHEIIGMKAVQHLDSREHIGNAVTYTAATYSMWYQ